MAADMRHPAMSNNEDLSCYFVTKHAWKGKYKRLFSVGSLGVTTYNPETLKVTNQWPYSDLTSIIPDDKLKDGRFSLHIRKSVRKRDEMKFSSEHMADILTDCLRFSQHFANPPPVKQRFNAIKYRWSEKRIPVVMEVNMASLDQVDPSTGRVLCAYDYKDMEVLIPISDYPGGLAIAHGGFGRLHLFALQERDALMRAVAEAAHQHVAITLKQSREPITFQYFQEHRIGKYSDDEHLTSHAEFTVQKVNPSRHGNEPVRRLLCLTETCLVERDPDTYFLVTAKPLCDVFALIRDNNEPQKLTIEYVRGFLRCYHSTQRDALIASVLDGVRASGNRDVCVKMRLTERGLRFGPFTVPVTEEVEAQHLKFLQQTPAGLHFNEVVARFNANISYSGLLHAVTQEGLFAQNKEKLIKASLQALIQREGNQNEVDTADLEAQFHALRRLVASKAGFQAFTTLQGMRETLGRKVVAALRRNDEAVTQAAIDTINALMQPMHDNYDIRQEQLNKASLMANKKFLENLLDIFSLHVLRGTGALVISAMLDFLTFAICPPYCETSDSAYFDSLLLMVADRGRVMFKLFYHPSMAIVKGAGLVMRSLIEEGDAAVGCRMQNLALAEGALPQHFLTAFFAKSMDHRSLAGRQLSRHLVSLWVTGNATAMGLLTRILPSGLLSYLESEDLPPETAIDHLFVRDNLKLAQDHMDEVTRRSQEKWRIIEKKVDSILTHWRSKIGLEVKPPKDDKSEKPVCLRKRRQRVKADANWKLFYYQFYEDHAEPNLIWNVKTREELRDALEKELHDFKKERDFCSHAMGERTTSHSVGERTTAVVEQTDNKEERSLVEKLQQQAAMVSWNHAEFKVIYSSLSTEIRVGDYYLRLLLEEDERVCKLERTKVRLSSTHSNAEGDTLVDSKEASVNGTEGARTSSVVSVEEDAIGAVGGVVKIKQSYQFFNDLFRRFLQYHQPEMKCMCLQAMAIVYGRCHEEIGPVSDTDLIVGMLERTTDRLERDRLLFLIEKLVLNKKNSEELIDTHGIRVLVDLLTLAHLHVSRAHTPLQSNVIEAAPDCRREGQKEWYYQAGAKEQLGPFSFEEMKEQYTEGQLTAKTRVWSQGMEGWRPLERVPQLRWGLIATGQAVLNESDLATLVLNILIRVATAYPSRDEFGAVIRPMPRCKKLVSSPANLPHLVQLLLTFDPVLVEKVAVLLNLVMDENPYVSRVYLSGVFFFILMYTGSNVLPIARFLRTTHLVQAFRSDESDASDLMSRSILGHILPEAMVCFLENHTPEKFAQIFLGEYDTPEAIWNTEMRRYMIEKLASHLAEFTPRLTSNTRALYQYLPIPVIVYPQLEAELFCNTYYLRHLCDSQRFPDWPIRDPVSLLRDILKAWKNEVEKKPPTMSLNEAYLVLGIRPETIKENEEAVIRKAYFRLAQKYHPDKNPEGRDKFEEVNKAYEFLCSRSKLSDGPNPTNIVLILRAQSILFSRCKTVLEPHKYAGYPMLIKTIQMETTDDQLFSKETPLLAAACELAYHTVNTSALNAEEMRRENGIQVLQEAFSRCGAILSNSSKSTDLAVQVCGYVTVFYSVAAQFPECRERIQEMHQIVRDLLRVLYFKKLPQLCCLVAKCVSSFAVDFWLQTNMFENGALFHLMPFLFNYDYTLDEGGVERSEDSHKQETANRLALLSLQACSRLAGCPSESDSNSAKQTVSPDNPGVKKSLAALLTPYVARKLGEYAGDAVKMKDLLKTLNSNSCSPCLLWDNRSRAELLQYLDEQQQRLVKTGECDSDYGANFKYGLFSEELVVGEVFVRVYNEQKSFPLENPKSFTIDLLLYLAAEDEYMSTLEGVKRTAGQPQFSKEVTTRMHKVEMAMEALTNVIRCNPGVEIQCIGHFKLLFSMLKVNAFPMVQQRALEVILCVTGNTECLNDIAASDILVHVVMLFESMPQCHLLVIETLTRMVMITGLLKEVVYRGAIIYLVDLFCNSTKPEVRVATANLLSKMMLDKLVGKRIRAILLQFMPGLFMDAMRDNPESAVHLYETVHENPELIWNEETRDKLSHTVRDMKKSFYNDQLRDLSVRWSVPEDFSVQYGGEDLQLVVAGVYLRLYVANPGWVLRAPDDFLDALFAKWCDLVRLASSSVVSTNEILELVTTSLVCLLHAQPGLLDTLPRKGYVHKVFQLMGAASDDAVLRAGLQVVHQMANSKLCVSSMSSMESIGPIKRAIKARQDQLSLAGEALHLMFESGIDDLVAQALKEDLIGYLLGLLSTGLVMVRDPGPTKAHIVKALKAMQKSLQYGEQVEAALDKHPVWKEYKDQSHDLFLSNTSVAGYLTGRTPEVAGYLMSSSGMNQTSHATSGLPPPT